MINLIRLSDGRWIEVDPTVFEMWTGNKRAISKTRHEEPFAKTDRGHARRMAKQFVQRQRAEQLS